MCELPQNYQFVLLLIWGLAEIYLGSSKMSPNIQAGSVPEFLFNGVKWFFSKLL